MNPAPHSVGIKLLSLAEFVGLLIVAVATLFAFGAEVSAMVQARTVTLADLLLLFIYLEVIAMAAIYMESGKLPVRMPLYIAIVALARYLILDMKNLDTWRILGLSGAILLIAVTVLAIRYGHCKYSYDETSRDKSHPDPNPPLCGHVRHES